jgi:L-2-hydroxyglutarate oxidase
MQDITIIGGGIVGLATALQILEASPGVKLTLLEKEEEPARHQTGNNSGVIHSGIYYKPGSLKALNCLEGYSMMTDFARSHNIPFEICGKVIVATEESELQRLDNIHQRGIENGLHGLKKINPEEIKEIEPHCAGIAGIFVPQTGIIDYAAVARTMASLIASKGGKLLMGNKLLSVTAKEKVLIVRTQKESITTKCLINCAGLYSDRVAALCGIKPDVKILPFRGEYYVVRKEKHYLVRNLIYPVPDPEFPFLGVHFTRFIAGGVEAGPNAVLAYSREGYSKTDISFSDLIDTLAYKGFRNLFAKHWKTGFGEFYRSYSKAAFTKALQKLIPEITVNDLVRGGAGVRASAVAPDGKVVDDFIIQESENAVHVLNAPSPAATASLSIGKTVAALALKKLHKA